MDDLIRALPGLLRAAPDVEEVTQAAAMVAWRRVSGEALKGCAVPFRLYRKTLVVAVPDQTWQKQLEAISNQLIFRINSLLGQAVVTYIEFRIDLPRVRAERERIRGGSVEDGAAANSEKEKRALSCVAGEISEAAAEIRDESLRHHFLVAAGSYIDARENKS